MKLRVWLLGIFLSVLASSPARADNRFIVRSSLPLSQLQIVCVPLSAVCTSVTALGDPLGQVFLLTSPLDLSGLLNLGGTLLGILNAEVDQVLSLIGPAAAVLPPPPALLQMTPTTYCGGTVWNGYATQPAADVVHVSQAQNNCTVIGAGMVADIDTGVDPNHPVLKPVLVAGYDFTRNQQDASELNDLNPADFGGSLPSCTASTCTSAFQVNQSSAAILDQSSAAILDTPAKGYSAFGHGTMVMGVIHLVAPAAKLMPLKAFKADGTGNLSDVLRAIYFAVANGANIINMSFETQTSSAELAKALDYTNQQGLIAAASAGNDGQGPSFLVYPAALLTDVMGVASVGSTTATESTRSSFSNYGDDIVWVAAPGEAIVTTYPFNTYAAGWGTSFSAPFVSGGASLLLNKHSDTNEGQAAAAIAQTAVPIGPNMGHGRLDLAAALQSLSAADYSMAASPATVTINAGDTASYTLTVTPVGGFNQIVSLTCSGFPSASICAITPSSITLDGTHSATATVTVTTTARASAPPLSLPRMLSGRRWQTALRICVWLVVLGVLLHLSRMAAHRDRDRLGYAAVLIAIAFCGYSCGGGGYGGGGGGGNSATLYSMTMNPTSVQGGSFSAGTVSLSGNAPSGGAVVSLSSSNTSAATVPASVTVAAGSSTGTFTANTSNVSTSTDVTISASYGGATKAAILTVTPASSTVSLNSLMLNPVSVQGGSPSTGTVTISGPAPSGGATVSLLSSNTSAATVPASVTVAAGSNTGTFTANTSNVSTSTDVTISASYGGATKMATLTVSPAPVTGTPAGTYDITIAGTSSNLNHNTGVQLKVN